MTRMVCHSRYRPVPRNRAIDSLNCPTASASTLKAESAPRRARGVEPLTRRQVAHDSPSGADRPATSGSSAGKFGFLALPPVVREQMVEHVIDGHRAQQVVFCVDHRTADQIVGSEVSGDRRQRVLGAQAGQIGVHNAADQCGGWLAQQSLQVHAAQIASRRRRGRRPRHEHQRGQRGRQVGITDPGQRLGDGGVGCDRHRLGGHQAARGVRRVAQQPSHVLGVLGIHPAQEQLGVGRRHRAQQVGGVVGIHRLEHVGRALRLQLPQHFGLLVFRQLLQHVGEPLVIERPDHLEAALVRQFADRLGHLDRAAGPRTAGAAARRPAQALRVPTGSGPAPAASR